MSKKRSRKKTFLFRTDADTLDVLRKLAKEYGRSMNKQIELAIRESNGICQVLDHGFFNNPIRLFEADQNLAATRASKSACWTDGVYTGNQDCSHCEDGQCGDNTNPKFLEKKK